MLPQLAAPYWVRLIGEMLTEQRARQTVVLTAEEERAVAKADRRDTRKRAKLARRRAPLVAALAA